jgi:hypothetical protein
VDFCRSEIGTKRGVPLRRLQLLCTAADSYSASVSRTHDVIVTGAREERGVYFLSENFDTGNLIRGQVQEGMFPPFMLKRTESRELILMPKFQGGVAVEALVQQDIKVVIDWRRGNATSRRQLPITVSVDTKLLRRIAGVE